jgi:hypothetical protein
VGAPLLGSWLPSSLDPAPDDAENPSCRSAPRSAISISRNYRAMRNRPRANSRSSRWRAAAAPPSTSAWRDERASPRAPRVRPPWTSCGSPASASIGCPFAERPAVSRPVTALLLRCEGSACRASSVALISVPARARKQDATKPRTEPCSSPQTRITCLLPICKRPRSNTRPAPSSSGLLPDGTGRMLPARFRWPLRRSSSHRGSAGVS